MASHSAEFIQEMKQRLLQEHDSLQKELEALGRKKGKNGDYVADFPDYGRNDEENASEVADYEATFATTEAAEERLKSVEEALKRIEEGTYGVTKEGDPIPEDRLRANPAATTLVK